MDGCINLNLEEGDMHDERMIIADAVRHLQAKAEAQGAELSDGKVLFTEISNDIKTIVREVGEIKTQTLKTNGRVTNLEDKAVEARVAQAERDAIAKHAYTSLHLVRDATKILALVGALVGVAKMFRP